MGLRDHCIVMDCTIANIKKCAEIISEEVSLENRMLELFQPIVKLQTFEEKKRGLAFNPFIAL